MGPGGGFSVIPRSQRAPKGTPPAQTRRAFAPATGGHAARVRSRSSESCAVRGGLSGAVGGALGAGGPVSRPSIVPCASGRPGDRLPPCRQLPLRPARTPHASGRARNIMERAERVAKVRVQGREAPYLRVGHDATAAHPHALATGSHVAGGHTCVQREGFSHNIGSEYTFRLRS